MSDDVENSAPIVMSYDSTIHKCYFSNIEQRIFDFDNDRYFELIDPMNSDVPVSKVKYDNTLFNVCELIDLGKKIPQILEFHNLSISDLMNSFDYCFTDEEQKQWDSFAKEYNELINWQKELTNISNGYSGLNKEEIISVVERSNLFIFNLASKFDKDWTSKFDKDWINGYLVNSDSQIMDLSVKDGIRYFSWANYSFYNVFSSFVIEQLGQFRNFEFEDEVLEIG